MGHALRLDSARLLVNVPMGVAMVVCLVAIWRRWRVWWVPFLAVGTTWTVGGYLAPVGPLVLGGLAGVAAASDRLRRRSAGVTPASGP